MSPRKKSVTENLNIFGLLVNLKLFMYQFVNLKIKDAYDNNCYFINMKCLNRFKLCSQEQNIVSVGFCNRHNKVGLFPQRLFLSVFDNSCTTYLFFQNNFFYVFQSTYIFCIMGGLYLISTIYKNVKHILLFD